MTKLTVGQSYVERGPRRVVTITGITPVPVTGDDIIFFTYLDEPDVTRKCPESEFRKHTEPQ